MSLGEAPARVCLKCNGKTPTFPVSSTEHCPVLPGAGCRVPCRACTGHALRSSGTGESDESGCQLSRLSSHESGDWSGTGCGTTKVQGQATKHDAACAGTAPRAHHDPTKMYIRAYGSTVRGQCLQVHSMRAGAAPGSRCSPTPFYTQTPVSSLKRCPHVPRHPGTPQLSVSRRAGSRRLAPRAPPPTRPRPSGGLVGVIERKKPGRVVCGECWAVHAPRSGLRMVRSPGPGGRCGRRAVQSAPYSTAA